MVEGIGKAIGDLVGAMFLALCIFVPLGLWKLGELVYWAVTHVRVTW